MKYLLVAALVLVVFWLWRNNREIERNDAAPRAPAPPKPGTAVAEMVACKICGLHLPKSEALIGDKGIYCSDAHRRQGG
jgi:uncharacterized protein